MSKTLKFALPVAGVDTLSNETALPAGAVRSAINVDIDRAGRYNRRAGQTQRLAMSGMHSLYFAQQKAWTVVAKDAGLFRLDTTSMALTSLATLRSTDPLEYTEYNGNLYYTNKTTLGWVPNGSSIARAVGVPTPTAPTLAVSAGGLTAGKYGVVVTYVDDRGEESGASELQTIELPEGGGIQLSNLQQQFGGFLFIYVTPPDGDILRKVEEIPAVFPTYVVSNMSQGSEVDTRFLVPLPAGHIVRWHNGRLLTANRNVLSFSEPMRPHLYNPAHNFIEFSDYIAFVECVVDGIYVGDNRGVWFLQGDDPLEFKMKRVSACRAVARSSIMVPPEHFPPKQITAEVPVAVWLSTSGYVVGMPGGVTVELQPERLKVPNGLSGRSVFLLRGGRKQIVTPVNSTTTAAFGTAVDSAIP